MTRANLLITGGTGLLGSVLTDKLVNEGFSVSALCRKGRAGTNPKVNWIEIDFLPLTDLNPYLHDVDILVHNASSLKLGNTDEDRAEIQAINIDFSRNLFEAAAKAGVKHILYTSSLSVIAKPLPTIIAEKAELRPVSFYAQSKYETERTLVQVASAYNITYSIFRISSPVSLDLEKMHNTVLKKWILAAKKGESLAVFGSGGRTQDFVSVEDVADAFLNSIARPNVLGIFNIASGNMISMLDLAELIANRFQTTIASSGIDEQENDRWNISINKAKKELDYSPKYTSISCIETMINSL